MDANTRKFSCVAFFTVSAVVLQISVAIAIVMAWGWVAMFAYAFVGTFINAFASRYCGWKIIP